MDENDSSSSSGDVSDSESFSTEKLAFFNEFVPAGGIDGLLLDKDLVESALGAGPQQEFLYNPQTMNESAVLPDFACLDFETQERLQAMLQAAGITRLSSDGRVFGDPELLRKLTSSVSNALDEAAAALSRLKSDEISVENLDDSTANVIAEITAGNAAVEDGESLLSLACSAGYYELAQVLLAMRTNVEDRGSKGDCTPLMEAASAGHADIVKLLIAHGAEMNAQSTNMPGSQSSGGNTALMYACAGGHVGVVRVLLKAGANVLLCNSNGHTPLMEAASAGHIEITQLLIENGAYDQREFKTGLLFLTKNMRFPVASHIAVIQLSEVEAANNVIHFGLLKFVLACKILTLGVKWPVDEK
uniref:Uncharacterized protein n=1 Tax=Romanomermis culicivorax TaxID=13658 RepID=A0A915IQD2_ROMCU